MSRQNLGNLLKLFIRKIWKDFCKTWTEAYMPWSTFYFVAVLLCHISQEEQNTWAMIYPLIFILLFKWMTNNMVFLMRDSHEKWTHVQCKTESLSNVFLIGPCNYLRLLRKNPGETHGRKKTKKLNDFYFHMKQDMEAFLCRGELTLHSEAFFYKNLLQETSFWRCSDQHTNRNKVYFLKYYSQDLQARQKINFYRMCNFIMFQDNHKVF